MDRDARFESLYRLFYPRVVGYLAHSFGFPREEASDLAQDVFVRVYQSLDDYRGEAEWAFIESVTRNVAYNMIRAQRTVKRSASVTIIDAEALRLSTSIDISPQEEQMVAKEMTSRLNAAIDALPSATRSVLLLRLNDESYNEIARHLGITVDAVKSRLRAAQVRLREQLAVEPFVPQLADKSLDNVVLFPSHYAPDLPSPSDEEAAGQLAERLSTVLLRQRHLRQQVDIFRAMILQHDERLESITAVAVKQVRGTSR